jgi:DNA repair protein RadD
MQLRKYQRDAIDDVYRWASKNKGHPCLEMPTGSGKSHIIAQLCIDAVQASPECRILMLTHVKELIEQNAEKILQHWPNAPFGIYSAGMRRHDLAKQITFASIQSVQRRADQIGHIDLVIVDEAHRISHKQEGGYRKLIDALTAINPALRVVGLTATPYRLGHGYITDEPALFSQIIKPDNASIERLITGGYLAPLRSKFTDHKLSVDGVHKRGGEYIESELQAAVDTTDNNIKIVDEVIARAGDRKSWLFFCVGVNHAHRIAALLRERGVSSGCITGDTPKAKREMLIDQFKTGKIRAMTNANVLTTGFDHPDLDLIAMLRPTLSTSLYVQMAGRGMRIKSHTDDCMVLDFAGVVQTHGPITDVRIKSKGPGKEGEGDAPAKPCPECHEIVHLSVMTCPACGYKFPPPPAKKVKLYNQDIMGRSVEPDEMKVKSWRWFVHTSRTSGKTMLMVKYYGHSLSQNVTEYFTVLHEGYSGEKSRRELQKVVHDSGLYSTFHIDNLDVIAKTMNDSAIPPKSIEYRQDGKFYRVMERVWR